MKDKIEKLQALKKLLDEGVISTIEFNRLKSELLSQSGFDGETSESTPSNDPYAGNSGRITVRYKVPFMLINPTFDLFVEDDYFSTHRLREAFSIDIPIRGERMRIYVTTGGLLPMSGDVVLTDLAPDENCLLQLEYRKMWSDFKFTLLRDS